MRLRYFCALAALLFPLSLFGLRGKVIDSRTKYPVWGCLVTHAGTGVSTRTGKDGSFELNTGGKAGKIVFSVPGYHSRTYAVPEGDFFLKIDILRKAPIKMGQVVVSRKRDDRVSVNRITAKQVLRRTSKSFFRCDEDHPADARGGDRQ